MYNNKTVTVIIPTYNEPDGLQNVIRTIPKFVDEILVVDSSTDHTAQIAREMGARVIIEPRRGYGRAYKTAFENITGDIVATTDSDGTYPIHILATVIDHLVDNNLDFVSCSRFPLEFSQSMGLKNVIGNKTITFATNILFNSNIGDVLSGMWVFKKSVLTSLNLTSNYWNFSEEIKIEAFQNPNIAFGEFHIEYSERIGTSKIANFTNYTKTGLKAIGFLFKKRFLP